MRILGVDPGLNISGYGLLDFQKRKPKLLEAGVIRGTNRDSLTARVTEIYQGLLEIIESFQPEVLAIEQLYSHYKRPRTAILMGHVRGVICLAAGLGGIPVQHYASTQVKKVLTGNGRASKGQMQLAIQRELALPTLPEPPDVADALAIALCHGYLSNTTNSMR